MPWVQRGEAKLKYVGGEAMELTRTETTLVGGVATQLRKGYVRRVRQALEASVRTTTKDA